MIQTTRGVLVGGGPAPGLNGVIGAAAIEAINNGLKVVALRELRGTTDYVLTVDGRIR